MTRFELRTSGIRSDCSTNSATTTAHTKQNVRGSTNLRLNWMRQLNTNQSL